MATKNNRRTQITKMLLKNSLIELMHHKTINQITIKEICEQADLNRSTFYLHYTDQFALLDDIENEIIHTTFEYLQNVSPNLDTLTYIETFLNYVKKNVVIFETLLCHQETAGFQDLFISKILEKLKDRLPFKCSDEIKSYIYTFLLHGCIHIIIDWINHDFDLSTASISNLIFELCDQCRQIPYLSAEADANSI